MRFYEYVTYAFRDGKIDRVWRYVELQVFTMVFYTPRQVGRDPCWCEYYANGLSPSIVDWDSYRQQLKRT